LDSPRIYCQQQQQQQQQQQAHALGVVVAGHEVGRWLGAFIAPPDAINLSDFVASGAKRPNSRHQQPSTWRRANQHDTASQADHTQKHATHFSLSAIMRHWPRQQHLTRHLPRHPHAPNT
jgi:hypothetical protein